MQKRKKIWEKMESIRNGGCNPLKIQVDTKTYLGMLEEDDWIVKNGEGYAWTSPKLVEYKDGEPTLFGLPLLVDDGSGNSLTPEWSIISEKVE